MCRGQDHIVASLLSHKLLDIWETYAITSVYFKSVYF